MRRQVDADAGLSYDAPVVLIRIFRICAIIEAITWIGLLASMYDKYIAHTHTEALHIFGTAARLRVPGVRARRLPRARRVPWSNRMTLLALASSVPPLATVPFERWAFHQRFDEQ